MRVPIIKTAFSIGGRETSDSSRDDLVAARAQHDSRRVSRGQRGAREVGHRQHRQDREVHEQYTPMTAPTPPIIDRGIFALGLRSSSAKYSALCQPP